MDNRRKKIRAIANKLNKLGYDCCRCIDCKTCELARKILDNEAQMPSRKLEQQRQISRGNIMDKIIETKKAYKEILEIVTKYKDICNYDVNDLTNISEKHLLGLELKEKYGFNIKPTDIRSLSWNDFGDYKHLGQFGEKYRRTISWSDDGKQPKDELLFLINFSTGAYIFGDDYPTELFQEFWQELKSYKPKYVDSHNNYLYFSLDNAGKIFNEFNDILKKYYEKNRLDAKQRKIKKLQEELNQLNNQQVVEVI